MNNNQTRKETRKIVREYKESKPEGSYSFGMFITIIGTKYVHVYNGHSGKTIKAPLEVFVKGKIMGVSFFEETLYNLGI